MAFRGVHMIEELLELYEEEDLLWNTTHEHYHKQDKRREALNRIGSVFGISAEAVNRKIINLRTYYAKEIRRTKQAKEKGDNYNSKWEYFKSMDKFLRPFVQNKIKVDQSDDDGGMDAEDDSLPETYEVKEENKGDDQSPEDDTITSIRNSKRKLDELGSKTFTEEQDPEQNVPEENSTRIRVGVRNRYSDESVNSLPKRRTIRDVVKPYSSQTESFSDRRISASRDDPEDVFGRHVANELRMVSDMRSRQLVKVKIQNILFEAQFGSPGFETGYMYPNVIENLSNSSSFVDVGQGDPEDDK